MKKLRCALAIAITLITANSFGQDRRLVDAFHCPYIENDIARLECFDKAYVDFKSAAAAAGDWLLKTDVSPIDDTVTTLIGVKSEEGGTYLQGPHQLIIRCSGSKLAAWIAWRGIYGSHGTTITSRIGKKDAKTQEWLPATNGSATFYPGDIREFVRNLMEVDRFIAQIALDENQNKLAVFNVRGLKQAASPIRDAVIPPKNSGDQK